jgi:membrane associated rhomboid family serine protease
VLLGLLGVGDARTDFMAHLCGFVAGLVAGWAVSGSPSRLLRRRGTQVGSASAAIALVAFGWALALAATAQP